MKSGKYLKPNKGCTVTTKMLSEAVAQALKRQREEIKKELEEYICNDCSTPNFIHIVVPKDYWNSQSPSGVEE